MREIKFRGKNIETGKWIYGSLINNVFYKNADNTPCCYIIPDTGFSWGDCWEDYGSQIDENAVSPETVGEYTGLNDKNNTPIYEGDIIKSETLTIAPVVFASGAYRWHSEMLADEDCDYDNIDWGIIIGNIYEHPQLLQP